MLGAHPRDLVFDVMLIWFVGSVTLIVVFFLMQAWTVSLALIGSLIGAFFGMFFGGAKNIEGIPLGVSIGASIGEVVVGLFGLFVLLGSKELQPRVSPRLFRSAALVVLVAGIVAATIVSVFLASPCRAQGGRVNICHLGWMALLIAADAAFLALLLEILARRAEAGPSQGAPLSAFQ